MTETTLTQDIYAALQRALTGPKTGDTRRYGTSADRLEYLTDAVMIAIRKRNARTDLTINGITYRKIDVVKALAVYQSSKGALEQCQRMLDDALPKFNWGASALDANAVKLLNDAPIAVRLALSKYERRETDSVQRNRPLGKDPT
jgi:hypothetical protein